MDPVHDRLIDDALRRVAVIHQQHAIKGCLAILRLVERFPDWGPGAAEDLAGVLRGEPRVPDLGSQLPSSTDLGDVDACRRLVEKSLFPVAYLAVRRWAENTSLDAVLDAYRARACAEADYLGHNVSIYCSFLGMRTHVAGDAARERLLLDRFTEFVTATFHCPQNRIVFEADSPQAAPATEETVLEAAFRRPGYFGHQILAFVWARRFARDLGADGYVRVLSHLEAMSRWRIPEKNVFTIESADESLDEARFAEAVRRLAFHGPENIHRVTLADALVDVWDSAHDDRIRALSLSAARHFARSPRA